MKLIDSLRQHLLNEVQHLRTNPDRLIVTVEKGELTWSHGSYSHRQSYTAVIEIDEYPEHLESDAVILPLIIWYNNNQDPFDYKNSPISFDSYILNNGSTTVVFTVKLEESVVVKMDDDGKPIINHCEINNGQ